MASVARRPGADKSGVPYGWTVRYKDPTGSYRQRTFKLKKEADAYRSKVERELLEGEHIVASQRKTIRAAADAYIRHIEDAEKRGAMRKTTVAGYIQRLEALVVPHFAATPVNELEVRQIELWIAALRADGLSPKTVTSCISLLKTMIDLAIRYRWARSNPVIAIAPDVRRARQEPIREFRLDDVRALLAASAQRYYKAKRRPTATLQCFVSLAAFLGLRWGEIAGLQRKNVDLDAGILRIRTSLSRFGDLHEPKTAAGRRDVRMPSMMLTLLQSYLTDFPTEDPEGLIFTTASNRRIGYSNWWRKSWTKLLDRAGLADGSKALRFHALRHFAASWMIENGWPLPDVSAQLGHANVAITLQIYAHSIERRAQSLQAMDDLAGRLTGTSIVPVAPSPRALPLRTDDARPLMSLY